MVDVVDAVVFAKVNVDVAPDSASTAAAPFKVKFAAIKVFAPKYPPPATRKAPVVDEVEAAVFAKVNADVAPQSASTAAAPLSVKLAAIKVFAPKYPPPATRKAPVVEEVDAAVFAKVNADVAPESASTAAAPLNVKFAAIKEFAPKYPPPAT